MAVEKGGADKNSPSDERMSESDSDSADAVNPLYSLSTSKSDHSSLGRPCTSGVGDQVADENARALRSTTNVNSDDSASDARSVDANRTSGGFPLSSAAQLSSSRPVQTTAVSEEQQQQASVKAPPPPVVPVRLVRTPSSAKPATTIPKVDCPEKIVSRLKLGIRRRLSH